jgi:hypothetical protein
MVRMRSVLVMALALWLLVRYVGSDGLPEKELGKRRRRVSAGEEESI